jgi:hypothetical protein
MEYYPQIAEKWVCYCEDTQEQIAELKAEVEAERKNGNNLVDVINRRGEHILKLKAEIKELKRLGEDLKTVVLAYMQEEKCANDPFDVVEAWRKHRNRK